MGIGNRFILIFASVSVLGLAGWVAPARGEDTLVDKRPLSKQVEEDAQTWPVGSIIPLEFEFEPNVVVGNPALMVAEKDGANPRQIRLRPIKKGTTDVIIQDARGRTVRRINFNIITDDLSQKVMALRTLLADIEGITIRSVDAKIVIDGELIVPKDFDRIAQVQEAYPEVLNLVTLSRISREAIARRMQKEINDDPGGVNVTVRIMNDTFFLLGKVDSTNDREIAETIAQTYMPLMQKSPNTPLVQIGKTFAIRNLIKVEEAPPPELPQMVRITYHFMEIGKEFLKNSFFKWTPLMSDNSGLTFGQGTAGGTAASGTFTGTISNLLPKIQSGANGGFARVLFSTVGIGEMGKKIVIVRNDNVPYIEAVVNGTPVPGNAQVGINVEVTPNSVGGEKVRMETVVQFTALAGAGAGGKPRTTETKLENTLIVGSGESAALGGLISSDTAKDIDKDPEGGGNAGGGGQGGGGNALFSLLKSKAFRNKKTQFVVFITPKIIKDAAEGTADIKAKILNNSQKKRRRVVN